MIELNNWDHAEQLERLMGLTTNPRCDICLSRVDRNGELLGGVTFTNYAGASIQAHIAGFTPRFLSRAFLWFAFSYPFDQLKVKTLFGEVHSENTKALELDRRLGFKEVTRIDGIYATGQLVLLSMTRDECRWLAPPPELGAPTDGKAESPESPEHAAAHQRGAGAAEKE